jgi:hypothetical protein
MLPLGRTLHRHCPTEASQPETPCEWSPPCWPETKMAMKCISLALRYDGRMRSAHSARLGAAPTSSNPNGPEPPLAQQLRCPKAFDDGRMVLGRLGHLFQQFRLEQAPERCGMAGAAMFCWRSRCSRSSATTRPSQPSKPSIRVSRIGRALVRKSLYKIRRIAAPRATPHPPGAHPRLVRMVSRLSGRRTRRVPEAKTATAMLGFSHEGGAYKGSIPSETPEA